VQVFAEIGVVLESAKQFRPGPDGANRDGLGRVAGSAPVEAGLPRHHAPEYVLRHVTVIALERLPAQQQFAQIGIQPESREMFGNELIQRFS